MLRANLALCFLLGAANTACKSEEAPPPPPPAPAAPAPAPPAAPAPAAAPPAAAAPAGGSGSVTGTVKVTGKAPAAKELNRKSDPYCAKTPMKDQEVVVGKDSGLANVLVRLTKAPAGSPPAPASEILVAQEACMYTPRVQGAQAGQTISVKNGDQTLHNVHTYRGAATWFNQAQPQGLPPITKKVDRAGDVIKFKCDVHPWMTGYVIVTDHPYFAVTKDDGSFTLDKVPAGSYTVEAWHEKYGTKTMDVTVAADKPGEAKFEFAAGTN